MLGDYGMVALDSGLPTYGLFLFFMVYDGSIRIMNK